MSPTESMLLTILLSIIGSSGVWSVIQYMVQKRDTKESAETKAIKSLLHNSLYKRCREAIAKGYITPDEYTNIQEMYDPYKLLNGNGTIKKLVEGEVNRLPIREDDNE